MTARVNLFEAAPQLTKEFIEFGSAVQQSGLEKALLSLIEVRASQINGCANCLNMHTAEARKNGETEQRLHLVAAWREAPVFSDRERAALGWTEYLTRMADQLPSDDVYAELDRHFTKDEQVKLTMMIGIINAWNRLAVGFRLYEASLGW